MRVFDKKFGADLLRGVPTSPGVYQFLDGAGTVIYVGKAKSLRRRLTQYRLASKVKKHRRMRHVVRQAASVIWQELPTHLEACLREIRLIQKLRPALNISGAFSFLYPYIGLDGTGDLLRLAYTTQPQNFPEFSFHGAFRSRELCGEAFFSLVRLLMFVGHKEPAPRSLRSKLPRGSYVVGFRRLPADWRELWEDLLAGRSRTAISALAVSLVEHPGARSKASTVQSELDALLSFWVNEAVPLRQAIVATGYLGVYPVPQGERDPLFIQQRVNG